LAKHGAHRTGRRPGPTEQTGEIVVLSLPSTRRARRAAAVAVGLAATLLLAACGGGAGDEPSSSAGSDATDAAAYPVTIDSALGQAVIEQAPKRVVTVGWASQDIAQALGVTPVGIPKDAWAGDAQGYQPWFREAVEAAGDPLPTTYTDLPAIDVDAIVALTPDLVLAPQSGLDQGVYDQLSAFAPVVAYPDGPWLTTWQDQIAIVGKALGRSEQADGLADDISRTIEAAGAENESLGGKTFAYINISEPGSIAFYPATDPRVDFLVRLGMKLAPQVADLKVPEGSFYASLSLENADLLDDVDVIVAWFNSAEEEATAEAQPLFAQIPAVQRGSYLPLTDRQLAAATTVVTPLSVPWAIDKYVPLVAAAAAKA
jgi:iron complex transport system substrate-binding protein